MLLDRSVFSLKSIQNSEKLMLFLVISTMGCAFFQCIWVQLSNAFQILTYVLFFMYVLGHRDVVVQRFKKYKNIFGIYLVFIVLLSFSILASDNTFLGLKIWFKSYVIRVFPLFLILLTIDNKKYLKYILLALLASFAINTVYSAIWGMEGDRLRGIYGHNMVYAGFACICGPFIFLIPFAKKLKFSLMILWFLAFALFTYVILMNGARSAWIGLVVTYLITILIFCKPTIKSATVVLCGLVIGIATVSFLALQNPMLSQRFESLTSINGRFNSERLLLWKSSVEMFKDSPLVGVGMGDWADEYHTHYIDREKAREPELSRAHSNVFQFLGETGGLGLLGFLTFFGYIICSSFMRFLKLKNYYDYLIFGSTLALMLQGLSEYNLGHSNVMKFYWLFIGCCWVLAANKETFLNWLGLKLTNRGKK